MRRKSSRKKSNVPSILTIGATWAANSAAEHKREREREKREAKEKRAAKRGELNRKLDSIAASYERARINYTDGEYTKALDELTQTISMDARHTHAYFMKGLIYRKDPSTVQAAITNYSKVVEIDPEHDAAFHNRGLAHIQIGDYDKAIEDFERAIELDPSNANSYNSRGIAFKCMGQYERALMDFDHAIGLQPDHKLALSNRLETNELMWKSKFFVSDAIERLASLRDRGFLTEEEFLTQKAKLLERAF